MTLQESINAYGYSGITAESVGGNVTIAIVNAKGVTRFEIKGNTATRLLTPEELANLPPLPGGTTVDD